MITETLQPVELLPTKFEPKFNSRFILELDDIEPFLVKVVRLPQISVGTEGRLTYKTNLEVVLYNPIAPSGSQGVMTFCKKALKRKNLKARIKQLDSIGTVISLWEFVGVSPELVRFDDLDYSEKRPSLIHMNLSFRKMTLKY